MIIFLSENLVSHTKIKKNTYCQNKGTNNRLQAIVLNAEVNLGIRSLYCTLRNVDIHFEIC